MEAADEEDEHENGEQSHEVEVEIDTQVTPTEEQHAPVQAEELDDDLAKLESLSNDTILQSLAQRYANGRIYTSIGDILLALNPFEWLPLYSDDIVEQYASTPLVHTSPTPPNKLKPHVYKLANKVYNSLLAGKDYQVCVISGESGSGKTETSKLFIQHLSHLSMMHSSVESTKASLEQQVELTGLVLETFGNASTIMNKNSSRFGKYIDILFEKGTMTGARISHYLLEKSRVALQGEGELNYHIFMFLLQHPGNVDEDGCKPPNALTIHAKDMSSDNSYFDQFFMGEVDSYNYISNPTLPWHKPENWNEIYNSMICLGISEEEIRTLVEGVCIVLEFGEIQFKQNEDEEIIILNHEVVDSIASRMGVSAEELATALTTKTTMFNGVDITKFLSLQKCLDGASAIAKHIYASIFAHIVNKINTHLSSSSLATHGDNISSQALNTLLMDYYNITPTQMENADESTVGSIGILDIFGFESFRTNGFEQLCINVANERLQYYFNEMIFKMDRTEYEREGVEVCDAMFENNEDALSLFFLAKDKNANLFSLVDEESKLATGSDDSLYLKMKSNLTKTHHNIFTIAKTTNNFVINHFAGSVTYNVLDFVEKNRDDIPEMLLSVVESTSKENYVEIFDAIRISHSHTSTTLRMQKMHQRRRSSKNSSLQASDNVFKNMEFRRKSRRVTRSKKKSKSQSMDIASWIRIKPKNAWSVSSVFLLSLCELMERLEVCDPVFVRCVSPNTTAMAKLFDNDYVLRQLLYTGVCETARIRKDGYSTRMSYTSFKKRYGPALILLENNQITDAKDVCVRVLEVLKRFDPQVDVSSFVRFGVSKVFLRYMVVDSLDTATSSAHVFAIALQSICQGFVARKKIEQKMRKILDMKAKVVVFLTDATSLVLNTRKTCKCLNDEDELRDRLQATISAKDMTKYFRNPSQARKHVEEWWLKYERPKAVHCDDNQIVYLWFHGIMDRDQAEILLAEHDCGTFLVRVNVWTCGYVLSFNTKDRCRHYKVHSGEERGGYKIFGEERDFGTLANLVEYYTSHAINALTGNKDNVTNAVEDVDGSNSEDAKDKTNNGDVDGQGEGHEGKEFQAHEEFYLSVFLECEHSYNILKLDQEIVEGKDVKVKPLPSSPPPPEEEKKLVVEKYHRHARHKKADVSLASTHSSSPTENASDTADKEKNQSSNPVPVGDFSDGEGDLMENKGVSKDTVQLHIRAKAILHGSDFVNTKQQPRQQDEQYEVPMVSTIVASTNDSETEGEGEGDVETEDDIDEHDDPLFLDEYLRDPDNPPKWLYTRLVRQSAENLISEFNIRNESGAFIVRWKEDGDSYAEVVLSVVCELDGAMQFFHYILIREKTKNWSIQVGEDSYEEMYPYLEDVIEELQRHKHCLICRLKTPIIANRFGKSIHRSKRKPKPGEAIPSGKNLRNKKKQKNGIADQKRRSRLSQKFFSSASKLFQHKKHRHEKDELPAMPRDGEALQQQIAMLGDVPVEKWTLSHVSTWLNCLNLHKYSGLFQRKNITGQHLLALGEEQVSKYIPIQMDQQALTYSLAVLRQREDFNSNKEMVEQSISATKSLTRMKSVRSLGMQPIYAYRRRKLFKSPEEKLHDAVNRGDLHAVLRLLSNSSINVDLVAPDRRRTTPLFLAAESGRIEIVRALLEHDANPFLPNVTGWTPKKIALQHSRHVIVTMLEEAMLQRKGQRGRRKQRPNLRVDTRNPISTSPSPAPPPRRTVSSSPTPNLSVPQTPTRSPLSTSALTHLVPPLPPPRGRAQTGLPPVPYRSNLSPLASPTPPPRGLVKSKTTSSLEPEPLPRNFSSPPFSASDRGKHENFYDA
eukprot:m.28190 g.28190  ORF g.28190 m.28190 type:complete len:1827 (-) comp6024_c0_seq1:1190-6670(-)